MESGFGDGGTGEGVCHLDPICASFFTSLFIIAIKYMMASSRPFAQMSAI